MNHADRIFTCINDIKAIKALRNMSIIIYDPIDSYIRQSNVSTLTKYNLARVRFILKYLVSCTQNDVC